LVRSVPRWFRVYAPVVVLLFASEASAKGIEATALYSGDASVAAYAQRGNDPMTSQVSEPSTLLLFGAGLALVARQVRRVQSGT
jgi:hypothetical protein